MKSNPDLAPALHSRGFRLTLQRQAILDVLGASAMHLTPVQIHDRARRRLPGLTEPTVYRTLRQLALGGLVWQLQLENGHLAYELAGRDHHHLVCVSCGEVIELPAAQLTAIYAKLETVSGFKLNHDHLTLTGLCAPCQARHKSRRPRT